MGAGELIGVVPFGNSPSGFNPRSAAAFTPSGNSFSAFDEPVLLGEQPNSLGIFRRITHGWRC